MITGILGQKGTQSRHFMADGRQIPVTRITAGPCWVIRTIDGDHYKSVQLAFGTNKNIQKTRLGQIKKAGLEIKPRFLRELRVTDLSDLSVGQKITVGDVFAVGDVIRVTGTSSGKGFAGVVKRHGFAGGPRTHGQSDRERAPGSLGQTTTPGRVYRGKRMAGRMGSDRVTVRGLKVVSVDADTNVLVIKGLIPGRSQGLVVMQKEG